jgi:hypothetical protein
MDDFSLCKTLFGDGSERFLRDSNHWQTWRAQRAVTGGEVIPADAY